MKHPFSSNTTKRVQSLFWAVALLVCSLLTTPCFAQTVTTAPPSDFGLAASACVDVPTPPKLDAKRLKSNCWKKDRSAQLPMGNVDHYRRTGTSVRLFVTFGVSDSRQCVVDGYGTAPDQSSAIEKAIEPLLVADFGNMAKAANSTGAEAPFSQGQDFMVRNVMGVLSSEKKPAGLSIRFSSMRVAPEYRSRRSERH